MSKNSTWNPNKDHSIITQLLGNYNYAVVHIRLHFAQTWITVRIWVTWELCEVIITEFQQVMSPLSIGTKLGHNETEPKGIEF